MVIDMRKTPEDIIKVLHSITKLSVEDGQLDVFFDNSEEPMGISEFTSGSFTKELLMLIADYLNYGN